MKLLILFGILLISKLVFNLYYLLIVKHYYNEYLVFVKDNKSWFIKEHKQKISNLFKKAGIDDAFQPSTELTGYGMTATSTFSVFRNMSVLRKDIVIIMNGNFREAIGIYKQRVFETFNPIYWFESFLQLPKIILEYLGIKPESIFIRIIQIVWWVVVVVSTLVGIFFNNDFTKWITSIW